MTDHDRINDEAAARLSEHAEKLTAQQAWEREARGFGTATIRAPTLVECWLAACAWQAARAASEKPIAWWSGRRYYEEGITGGSELGSFREHEDTWHDLPVYAGWNNEGKPSRTDPALSPIGRDASRPGDLVPLANGRSVLEHVEQTKLLQLPSTESKS